MTKRPVCSKCNAGGTQDTSMMIQEIEDRQAGPLYGFGIQGVPIYPKKYRCGNCGNEWKKE